MTQINWVRATFVGAIAGGVVWAVIIKLISFEFGGMAWQARSFLVAGVVNAVLLMISWLRWRSATDERSRSLAAALWIVPFIGVAFFASIFAMGAAGQLLGT
jgi:hypothetical protein